MQQKNKIKKEDEKMTNVTEKQVAYLKKLGATQTELDALNDIRSASILITILKQKKSDEKKQKQDTQTTEKTTTEKATTIQTDATKNAPKIDVIIAQKVLSTLDALTLDEHQKQSIKLDLYLNDLKSMIEKDKTKSIKEIKKTIDENRSKRCTQYIEKQTKNYSDGCFIDNDIQYYTDSYFCVSLVKDDNIEIPKSKCNDYPLEQLKKFTQKSDRNQEISVQVNDVLKAKTKDNKHYNLTDKIVIDIDRFKTFIDFLNVGKTETIKLYSNGKTSPLYYEKDNGTKGILCPIKA